MSIIRDNLIRVHFARNVGLTIQNYTDDETIRYMAGLLIEQCNEATRSIEWVSVKINLATVERIMKKFSTSAYGNPDKNAVDILRLIGLAIAGLEDAVNRQRDPEKRHKIDVCLNTLLALNALYDLELSKTEPYLEAAADAAVMENILEVI
jgi:hypothetical protein